MIIRKFESYNTPKNILITIPKSIEWSEYEKELKKAENGDILNFKINNLPKENIIGGRCYICYNGNIIGYHIISGINNNNFDCTTTGKNWKGTFVQRTGKFYRLESPVPQKGFQGWRYYNV
jgi:hypothetical protein